LLPFAGGARPKINDQQRDQVRQYVLDDPDTTLREVQSWLETAQSIRLSLPTRSRLLAKLDLPRKKVVTRDGARPSGKSAEARDWAR
jgi:transposase